MKVFVTLIILSFSLTFISCNKDEHIDETTWVSEQFIDEYDVKYNIILTLTGNHATAKIHCSDYSTSFSITANGDFTREEKDININIENKNYCIDGVWSGKIDKKKMILNVVINELWGVQKIDRKVEFTNKSPDCDNSECEEECDDFIFNYDEFLNELLSAPKDIASKEVLPEWIVVKINAIEKMPSNVCLMLIYKCEWNKRTIYLIRDSFSASRTGRFSEDGKSFCNSICFYATAKNWTLIYEYGDMY